MKKIFFLLLLFSSILAKAQYTYQIVARNLTAADNTTSANIIGSGAAFHNLTWNVSGTVSGCSVRVDGSADGITWGTGDVIGATTCTSNGTTVSSSTIKNYVRINLVTITGAGATFTANLSGYITQPSGGGTLTSLACGTGITCSPGSPITSTGTISASGSSSSLRRVAFVMQDGATSTSSQIGEPTPGAFSGTFGGAITATSTCGPGRSTVSAASSTSVAGVGENTTLNWQYGKSPVFQSEISISTISTIRAWLALSDQSLATQAASATPAGNWAGFRFDTGAGDTHWQACTSASGSSGCTDTGITPDTSCHLFEINVTTGTNVIFKIDNTSVATVTTHLPANSVLMGWNSSVTTLAASAATLQYSFFYFSAGL